MKTLDESFHPEAFLMGVGKRSSASCVVLVSLSGAPWPAVFRLDELPLKLSLTFFINSINVGGVERRARQFCAPAVLNYNLAGSSICHLTLS